ncbi:hypothetical protein VE00_09954 [Pseudogymnoascus sp. WSF 3629]|nr:hypothetical protein VE00_09954 [Pseudogymnoascus sp. WSF 3629]
MARFSSLLNLLLGIWVALLCSLSLSAPLESGEISDLVKRDDSLYTIWNRIPTTQKAMGDSALFFRIDQSVDNAWGVTYLYGCTALLISDPRFVIVAHMQQETRTGTICIKDQTSLNNWLANTLQPALDQEDPNGNTMVELIHNTNDCAWTGTGVKSVISWLMDEGIWGVRYNNILPRPYQGSSGLGIPNPGQPQGLAVVRWLKPPLDGSALGTLQTFFNSDTPNRKQEFVRPGTRSVPESAQFGAQVGPEPNPAENSVLSSAEHPAPTYLAELLVPALLFSCTGETCQRRVHLADYSTEQSADKEVM